MSLRMRLFLLLGTLVALLVVAEWWLVRTLARDLSTEIGEVAFRVGESVVASVALKGVPLAWADANPADRDHGLNEVVPGGSLTRRFVIRTGGGETKTLDSSKDTIDFVDGSIGAYPNYFFVVDGGDVPDFFDMLMNYDGSPEYLAKVRKYGVDRADPDFWDAYDWFQKWLETNDPLRAGLYDLNRYYAEAADIAEQS